MKRLHYLIISLCVAAVWSPTAKAETKTDYLFQRNEIRIGWGDQLFESLVWHNPTSITKQMPTSAQYTYKERYRHNQHLWVEYQYRFNHWFSLGGMVDMSSVGWDLVTRDGKGHELFNYDFTVIEKYPDQWLCNSAAPDSVAPGLWSNPLTAGQTCTLTFDATTSFSGFCMMFYANPEGATVDISLLDKNGKELEKLTHNQKGDGAPTLAFSKTYGPDTYTLKFVSVSAEKHIDPTAGEMDGWFVIGTADPGDTAVTVGGDYTTNEYTRAGILAFLVGAVKESNAGENNNPGTADAAVIAIAAVACLALAGIVVAKKIK